MIDIIVILQELKVFTQNLMDNENIRRDGRYTDKQVRTYLDKINELSFEARKINVDIYYNLQMIRDNLFNQSGSVNLFVFGKLRMLLELNIFDIPDTSIWMYAHPVLREKCQKKFTDGHYTDAVSTAFKIIISRVRKFRADNGHKEILSDCNMMENTFADGKSLLHLTACSTTSENNIHNGYAKMLIGAVQAIRNPIAHDPIEMTEDDAARKLMLASDLMYRLDEAFEFFTHY